MECNNWNDEIPLIVDKVVLIPSSDTNEPSNFLIPKSCWLNVFILFLWLNLIWQSQRLKKENKETLYASLLQRTDINSKHCQVNYAILSLWVTEMWYKDLSDVPGNGISLSCNILSYYPASYIWLSGVIVLNAISY